MEAQTPFTEVADAMTPSPVPEVPTSSIATPFTANQIASASTSSADLPGDLETELPTTEVPPSTDLPDWLPGGGLELKDSEEWVDPLPSENDTSSFSASMLLSGDGDSMESDTTDFPRILNPGLDYQYDAPGFLDLVSLTLQRRA